MSDETIDKDDLISLLVDGSLFSKSLKNFECRPSQLKMVEDVVDLYNHSKTALVEAETGIGKSLAYLLPAIFWAHHSKKRTIISTNTIALQEQLITKDIPFLLDALQIDMKVVLAKGMHNYVCLRKLEDIEDEMRFFTFDERQEIEKIRSFVEEKKVGSRSDFPFFLSKEGWEKVSCEAESCTKVKCPKYKECFFFKARKEAEEASLLVVNHHLLFTDISLRMILDNYEATCLLPATQHFILDEAHHIEEVARDHFSTQVSKKGIIRQLNRLYPDKGGGKIRALIEKLLQTYPDPIKRPDDIKKFLSYLEVDFPQDKQKLFRLIEKCFGKALHFLSLFTEEEKLRIVESQISHPLWQELQSEVQSLVSLGRSVLLALSNKTIEKDEKLNSSGLWVDIQGILFRLEKHFAALLEFVFSPLTCEKVRWMESTPTNIEWITADLDIAPFLQEALFSKLKSALLCSATMTANRNFTFIKQALGIQEAVEKVYESPFDFESQAHFFVPKDISDPEGKNFSDEACEYIYEAILASEGHAFVLFTSYATLKKVATTLHARFEALNYPLLCQGMLPTKQLIEHFKKTKSAVLFGTDSFWEGVDVVGDQLRCVILTKLPFKVPTDPLFQARVEKIKANGDSPFFDFALPQAIMKFKQGFGRLIRSKSDRGCIICLDQRLLTKPYGKLFLKNLPIKPSVVENKEELSKKMKEFYSLNTKTII